MTIKFNNLEDSDRVHDLFYVLAYLRVIKIEEIDSEPHCVVCDRYRKPTYENLQKRP